MHKLWICLTLCGAVKAFQFPSQSRQDKCSCLHSILNTFRQELFGSAWLTIVCMNFTTSLWWFLKIYSKANLTRRHRRPLITTPRLPLHNNIEFHHCRLMYSLMLLMEYQRRKWGYKWHFTFRSLLCYAQTIH